MKKNKAFTRFFNIAVLQLFFMVVVSARTVNDVRWLYHYADHLDVTRIDYGSKYTTLTFSTDRHLDGSFKVGHGIFIVGDDGERHRAINSDGITLDSVYTIHEGEQKSFTIDFEPLPKSNICLDVRAPGQFSIYGLHDKDHILDIPKAVGKTDASEVDDALFQKRDITIEGTLHDPYGNLGDIVQINYIAPRNMPEQRNSQASKVDNGGRFSIVFPMFAPQLMGFLKPYNNGHMVNGALMARPGDRLSIVLYDSSDGREIRIENLSGGEPLNRLANAPIPAFDGNKYIRNLNSRYRFAIWPYRTHYDEVMESYNLGMDFANYVCWHYRLSPFETKLYLDQVRAQYMVILLSTDIALKHQASGSNLMSSIERKQYLEQLEQLDYSYLRDIDPNDAACVITNLRFAIELIVQLAPIEECFRKVAEDMPNRWHEIIALQQETLNRITGWKGQTFVMEQVIVEDLFNLGMYNISPTAEEYEQVRQMLRHPYSRQCFDIYYADHVAKQTDI